MRSLGSIRSSRFFFLSLFFFFLLPHSFVFWYISLLVSYVSLGSGASPRRRRRARPPWLQRVFFCEYVVGPSPRIFLVLFSAPRRSPDPLRPIDVWVACIRRFPFQFLKTNRRVSGKRLLPVVALAQLCFAMFFHRRSVLPQAFDGAAGPGLPARRPARVQCAPKSVVWAILYPHHPRTPRAARCAWNVIAGSLLLARRRVDPA